jgi:hypothetical protein
MGGRTVRGLFGRSTWAWLVALGMFVGCGDPTPSADAGEPPADGAPPTDAAPDDGAIPGDAGRDAGPDAGGDAGGDAAAPSCTRDGECDDGQFCNGAERCGAGVCVAGAPPCSASECDESRDVCACDTADADGDGADSLVCGGDDCDDGDARRYPGATETCDADGLDEDCDPTTFGARDLDGDGALDALCCNGLVCGTDCDDTRGGVGPSATEVCNGADEDCDAIVDEGVQVTLYTDADRDGFGAGAASLGCPGTPDTATNGDDCDDTRAATNPSALEVCDGVRDDDCDMAVDEGCDCTTGSTRACGSDVGECVAGTQSCIAGTWGGCDAVGPAAEACNGLDDDCDGETDEGLLAPACFVDDDADGYGVGVAAPRCADPTRTAFGGCPIGTTNLASPSDCDDTRSAVSPIGIESCNGIDDDCDGTVDDPSCTSCPAGYRREAGDCVDIDECLDLNGGCDPRTTCTNVPGSRTCGPCPTGFTDTGTGGLTNCLYTDPFLDGLATSTGALSPAFTRERLTYTVRVPATVESLRVTATIPALAVGAVARIDGVALVSGTPSAPIALPLGQTTIRVEYTIESGGGVTYELTVLRGFDVEQFVKAGAPAANMRFGNAVSLSGDGSTLAVGARFEGGRGAVFVFRQVGGAWVQDAVVRPTVLDLSDEFGASVSLSEDGTVLAVGATLEDSGASGINGNASLNTFSGSGAAYVFRRAASAWTQEAYVKASNPGNFDNFGDAVALSGDGATLVVGARQEDSNATGVNGAQGNDLAINAGAVYVFRNDAAGWTQRAYLKPHNTASGMVFGAAVAVSRTGSLVVVGAPGPALGTTALTAGAVYTFEETAGAWAQAPTATATVGSNTETPDRFGVALALSADGTALAVGVPGENGSGTGIGADPTSNAALGAGAAYVFRRSAGGGWDSEVYVKATNAGASDAFGTSVGLSANGDVLVVGAPFEDGSGVSPLPDPISEAAPDGGAVYVYRLHPTRGVWESLGYLKARVTDAQDALGTAVAVSADGTLVIGTATGDDAAATDPADNTASNAGAAWTWR